MPNSVINLSTLVGGKPIWKSITMWGIAIWTGGAAVLDQACGGGLLSESLCMTLTGWVETVGAVLTVVGLRRAATAPNSG